MIGGLLRLDPVPGILRITVPLAFAFGLLLAIAYGELPAGFGRVAPSSLWGSELILFLVALGLLLFFLVTSGFWTRCQRFDLTLPISARRLWLARNLAIFMGWALPMLAFCLPLVFQSAFRGGQAPLHAGVLRQAMQTGAFFLLASILLQVPAGRLQRIPLGAGYLLYSVIIGIGLLLACTLIAPAPPVSIFALLAAALLGAGAYLRVPGSYVLFGPRASAGLDVDRSAANPRGQSRPYSPHLLHMALARLLLNWPGLWLIGAIGFIYGASLARFYRLGSSSFLYILFTILWFVAQLAWTVSRLHRVDAWPVSRRVILPYCVLPYVLLFLLGAGVFELHWAAKAKDTALVRYDCQVVVPSEFWQYAPTGEVPVQIAPWGESYRPQSHQLLGGRGPALYLPYEHGSESSPAFITWQLERAMARVFGSAPPTGDRTRYAAQGEEFMTALDSNGACKYVPAAASRSSSPLHAHTAMLGCCLGILGASSLGVGFLRSMTPKRGRRLARWILPIFGLFLALLLFAFLLGWRFGISDPQFIENVLPVLVRKLAETLSLGSTVLALITAGVAALAYFCLQWAFDQIEALPHKRSFLVEYDA